MARPLRIQFPGAFYHITCRGIERRNIYGDDQDRQKCLTLLTNSLEIYQVVLLAYCLMDNHFHLIIQTRKANCSEFMRHFNICDTAWFNWRHHRSGNLYQGRYKAFLVDADHYLLELTRYLHLNPVRTKSSQALDYREQWRYALGYRWSSLTGYIDERRVMKYVNYNFILSFVGGRAAYRRFVIDGLRRGMADPFKAVKAQVILGDDEFVKRAKGFLRRVSHREQPSYQAITPSVMEPEVIIGLLRRSAGIAPAALQQRRANGVLRGIVAELLYRYSEITQAAIGRLLGGIDYMAVAQLRKRLKEKLADPAVRQRYMEIETQIKSAMSNV